MSLLSNPSDPCLSADMTFGIELEFIVAFPKNFFNPEDAIAAISRALVAAGIDSTGHEKYDEDAEIFSNKPEFSQWTVKREFGLFLSDTERAILNHRETSTLGVEISSRKLSYAEDWKAEVQTVLMVLYNFNRSGVKLITNATTGFHIHVGFGDGSVPLRTAKSVLQLCTAPISMPDCHGTSKTTRSPTLAPTFSTGLSPSKKPNRTNNWVPSSRTSVPLTSIW
jgi:hypothetical protein